jgi:hypothetical protein
MRHLPLLLSVVLSLLLAPPARAEDLLVPFDSEGRVEQLTGQQARTLGVLGEYPDLQEARLYRDTDSGAYTLELTERREAGTVRRRVPLSAEHAEALRDAVRTRLAETPGAAVAPGATVGAPAPGAAPASPAASAGPNHEGRFALVGASTLLGLGYYAWALPAGLRVDGGGAAFGVYALTAAGSLVLPLLLTADRDVTWGTTNGFLSGATRGPLHGAMLGGMFASAGDPNGGTNILLTSVAVGALEAGLGTWWASSRGLSAGDVYATTTGVDFGLGYGLGLWSLVAGSGAIQDVDVLARGALGAMLAGAAAGGVGATLFGHPQRYTWGDVEVVRAAGVLGTFLTVPIIAWTLVPDVRAVAGLMMAGTTAGLLAGEFLVRGHDFGLGPALLVDLGALTGALVGFGVSAFTAFEPRVALTAAALGAVGGYALTYGMLSPAAASAGRADALPSVRMHVDPMALMGAAGITPPLPALTASTLAPRGSVAAPVLSVSGAF